MSYYIADGASQRGPYKVEELAQGVRPETLVWKEGAPNWVRADEVDELVKAGIVAIGMGPVAGSAPPGRRCRSRRPRPPATVGSPATPSSHAPSGGCTPFPTPPTAGYAPPPQQQPGYQSTAAPVFGTQTSSNRIAAGVCGILLGAFGVHKFILGMNTPGIIMLVVSLVGGFVTCGAVTGVMSIIGIVEGIIYLTKTDEQFHETYVVQKKEWF